MKPKIVVEERWEDDEMGMIVPGNGASEHANNNAESDNEDIVASITFIEHYQHDDLLHFLPVSDNYKSNKTLITVIKVLQKTERTFIFVALQISPICILKSNL